MSDSEDYYFDLDSDMEDTEIEKFLEKKEDNKQIDTFLAYTAERLFHGGGTPPNASDNIPSAHSTTLTVPQVLFQQPKIAGVKCPLRMYNYNKPQRKFERENFNEFFQTLNKDSYEAKELAELYGNYFNERIEPKDLGRLKIIKEYFISIHKQKRVKDLQGQSKKVDYRIFQKRKSLNKQ